MAGELALHGGGALKKAAKKGALKKAAKKGAFQKIAAKKTPGKKAPGKKAPGKKAAGQGSSADLSQTTGAQSQAFHHLQRAVALLSLLEQESGGDLRMLLDEGVRAYRLGRWAEATGLLNAAEHLGMAGLYAARAEHRVTVQEPPADGLEKMLDRVAVRLDRLADVDSKGVHGRLRATAADVLDRAEAADHDLHLAWELVSAANGICAGLDGTTV